ncbi:hypothetical protein JUJ52_05025 [Virgibacillus sp. AGTR]|uniref:hypothetical protein n=1 Tax=Virgibacillus sp. AGTR TaxID=2812055 RepID=UPI001D169A6D|nr:hypothetical protein [Virgibacillus sp. AGTR]MCC2249326.1 hypothetical protein [Virgibacillus sp. AGTR]
MIILPLFYFGVTVKVPPECLTVAVAHVEAYATTAVYLLVPVNVLFFPEVDKVPEYTLPTPPLPIKP